MRVSVYKSGSFFAFSMRCNYSIFHGFIYSFSPNWGRRGSISYNAIRFKLCLSYAAEMEAKRIDVDAIVAAKYVVPMSTKTGGTAGRVLE